MRTTYCDHKAAILRSNNRLSTLLLATSPTTTSVQSLARQNDHTGPTITPQQLSQICFGCTRAPLMKRCRVWRQWWRRGNLCSTAHLQQSIDHHHKSSAPPSTLRWRYTVEYATSFPAKSTFEQRMHPMSWLLLSFVSSCTTRRVCCSVWQHTLWSLLQWV